MYALEKLKLCKSNYLNKYLCYLHLCLSLLDSVMFLLLVIIMYPSILPSVSERRMYLMVELKFHLQTSSS